MPISLASPTTGDQTQEMRSCPCVSQPAKGRDAAAGSLGKLSCRAARPSSARAPLEKGLAVRALPPRSLHPRLRNRSPSPRAFFRDPAMIRPPLDLLHRNDVTAKQSFLAPPHRSITI